MNVEKVWVSAKGWPGGGVGLGSGVSVSFPRYIVEIYGLWATLCFLVEVEGKIPARINRIIPVYITSNALWSACQLDVMA